MSAQMPDIFNLDLGDAAGEDFTSQVAAQNQQMNPSSQGWGSIIGADLSSAGSAAVAPNTLANPTPSLTSAATLPAGLSTPATQGATTTTTSPPATAATPIPNNMTPRTIGVTAGTAATLPGTASTAATAPSAASAPAAGIAVGGGVPNPNAVQGAQYAPAVASQPYNPSTNYPTIYSGEGFNQFMQAAGFESGSPDQSGTMPLAGRTGGDSPSRLAAFEAAQNDYSQQQAQVSPIPGLSAQQFLTEEQTPGTPYYGGSYGLSIAQMNAMLTAQGATPSEPTPP